MNTIAPSLIETIRCTDGHIPLLTRHLQRLSASATALHYSCPLAQIENSLQHLAKTSKGQDLCLRLLLHVDGTFELQQHLLPVQSTTPCLIALAKSRLQTPNIWLQHKTTQRPLYDKAHAWLQFHPDYFDCIFLNQHDAICEGSRCNVYVQLDGHWYTPPLACGVLPGVIREVLLESGQVHERILNQQDLSSAQFLRISNALHGWRDVKFEPDIKAI